MMTEFEKKLADKKACVEARNAAMAEIQKYHGIGRQLTDEESASLDKALADLDAAESRAQALDNETKKADQKARLEEIFAADRSQINRTEHRGNNRPATYLDEARFILGWARRSFGVDEGVQARNSAAVLGLDYQQIEIQKSGLNMQHMNYRSFQRCQVQHLQNIVPDFDWDKEYQAQKEYRDAGNTTGHAEMISPGFLTDLTRARLQFGGLARFATVIRTDDARPMKWPTIDYTTSNAEIKAEGAAQDTDTTVDTSDITLTGYKGSSGVLKLTSEILQDSSAIDWVAMMPTILGEGLGRFWAPLWITGTGSSQPTGINADIQTAVTAASATAVTTDELIDLQGALDDNYEGAFYMRKATKTAIRKLTLTDNQYIWQPGLQLGAPDMLLGDPIRVDHGIPAMATGNNAIYHGDASAYKIRFCGSINMYRLAELYRVAEDSDGFLATERADAKLLRPGGAEPINALTMA